MSEQNNLHLLNERVDALLNNLTAGERRRLARDIARTMRGSQARRIRANRNPDGSAHAPRKPQEQRTGRRRRGSLRMFRKLHRTQFMRPDSNPNAAGVGFKGLIGRIAREHHYGLRARVNKTTQVQMEERQLLGFSKEDLQTVEDMMIQHLAKR